MAKGQSSVLFMRDFTGGLNNSSPAQQLRINETPDCMDVAFDADGGFTVREGLAVAAVMAVSLRAVGAFSVLANDYALFQGSDGALYNAQLGSGATSISAGLTDDFNEQVRLGLYGGNAYFANTRSAGAINMKKWNGVLPATVTTLTNTFNSNYLAPTGGNMPKAKHVAAHQGFMWVANTVESSVANTARVRFSHPLKPEDWHPDDYIDIDPSDPYDEITAIVPFGGTLMVFKRRAVYAIYGTDSTNFVMEQVGGAVGAVSREAIAVGITRMYWWSTDGNMMQWDGRELTAIGQRITGPVKSGLIAPGADVKVVWHNDDVVHCHIPTTSGGFYHYVFFANIGRGGCWTRYGWSFTSAVYGRRKNGETYCYFTTGSPSKVVFESSSFSGYDQTDTSGGTAPIRGYWISPWLSAGETATMKRWRRARITAFAEAPCTLQFNVYHDFDETSTRRQFDLAMAAAESGGGVWGQNWGSMIWAADTSRRIRTFAKLPVMGKAHAVSFKISCPDNTSSWAVDSVALPYERAAIR